MPNESAVLIPKIDPTEKTVQETSVALDNNQKPKKTFKIKPVFWIVPLAIVVLLVALLVPPTLFALKAKSSYEKIIPLTKDNYIS